MKALKSNKRLTSLFKKKYLFIAALVLLMAALFIAIYSFVNRPSSSAPPTKKVAQTNEVQDEKLSEKGIDLSNSIVVVGDKSETTSFKSGSSIKVIIKLTNTENQQSRFLTLKTSLNPKNLYDIRNIQGTTGIAREDDQLVIKNVSTLPGQTQEVSFEATLNFYEDADISFSTHLIDAENTVITKSKPVNYKVSKG